MKVNEINNILDEIKLYENDLENLRNYITKFKTCSILKKIKLIIFYTKTSYGEFNYTLDYEDKIYFKNKINKKILDLEKQVKQLIKG